MYFAKEQRWRISTVLCAGEGRAASYPVDVPSTGISRASYYRWLDAEESPTTLRHLELTGQVKTMFDPSVGIIAHRMVHTKLAAAGIQASVGSVAAIMAEDGCAAKRIRAFKRTTTPSDPDKVFAAIIGRDFTSRAPGTRLVGDVTYLRTDEGWLYLATVIDPRA